jgi:hypothetical protein
MAKEQKNSIHFFVEFTLFSSVVNKKLGNREIGRRRQRVPPGKWARRRECHLFLKTRPSAQSLWRFLARERRETAGD